MSHVCIFTATLEEVTSVAYGLMFCTGDCYDRLNSQKPTKLECWSDLQWFDKHARPCRNHGDLLNFANSVVEFSTIQAEGCHGGGQLCSRGSAQQPGGSWAFTSQLCARLSDSVPFRAQTVYSPCCGHPAIVRVIWKALRIFFLKQVKAICICFSLEDFTGQLRRPDIEHAEGGFPLRRHLHHLSFLCHPLTVFPESSQLHLSGYSVS